MDCKMVTQEFTQLYGILRGSWSSHGPLRGTKVSTDCVDESNQLKTWKIYIQTERVYCIPGNLTQKFFDIVASLDKIRNTFS